MCHADSSVLSMLQHELAWSNDKPCATSHCANDCAELPTSQSCKAVNCLFFVQATSPLCYMPVHWLNFSPKQPILPICIRVGAICAVMASQDSSRVWHQCDGCRVGPPCTVQLRQPTQKRWSCCYPMVQMRVLRMLRCNIKLCLMLTFLRSSECFRQKWNFLTLRSLHALSSLLVAWQL